MAPWMLVKHTSAGDIGFEEVHETVLVHGKQLVPVLLTHC